MLRSASRYRTVFFKSTRALGLVAGGFFGNMAYQARQQQPFDPKIAYQKIHQHNIQERLKATPEQVEKILLNEEKDYDQVQREMPHFKPLVDVEGRELNEELVEAKEQELATKISEKYKGEKHLLVLTMQQGGATLAAELKPKLEEKGLIFREDNIISSRYGNSQKGGEPQFNYLPSWDKIVGRKILIIEDLIEEGVTVQAAKKKLVELGAEEKDISIVVLLDKDKARKFGYKHVKSDFMGFVIGKDIWVIGKGCDHKRFLRSSKLQYLPEKEQELLGYKKK